MKNNVLVFSIALNCYDQLFRNCIDTQIEYCYRCKYEYVLVNKSPRPLRPAEAAWLKIPLTKSALEKGYEWVAFIDADCEVRSHAPCFSDYLDAFEKRKSVFMAPGRSGRINSGVMFLRNSTSALGLLNEVIDHVDDEVPEEDRAPYENGHMIYFGKNSSAVHMLDHNLWNNNSVLDEKSYIQHYGGGSLRKWYMDKRAPVSGQLSHQAHVRYVLDKLGRKLQRLIVPASHKKLVVSKSMDELLPYFEHFVPAFRRTASSTD